MEFTEVEVQIKNEPDINETHIEINLENNVVIKTECNETFIKIEPLDESHLQDDIQSDNTNKFRGNHFKEEFKKPDNERYITPTYGDSTTGNSNKSFLNSTNHLKPSLVEDSYKEHLNIGCNPAIKGESVIKLSDDTVQTESIAERKNKEKSPPNAKGNVETDSEKKKDDINNYYKNKQLIDSFFANSYLNTYKQLITEKTTNDSSVNKTTNKCQLCDYITARKTDLDRHMRKHTGEKPYSCQYCHYKAAQKVNLLTHLKKHTGEELFPCPHCIYKATRKGDLATHMKRHTGEKPYSCPYCEYRAALKGHLVIHMATHTDEKPYSCPHCQYRAAQKVHLMTHMMTHTGEKPYSCHHCEYKTVRKERLVTHMMTHTGQKPFACRHCKYKTIQKTNLVKHMITHTGEKPHACPYCSYKSIQKARLVIHMKKHTT